MTVPFSIQVSFSSLNDGKSLANSHDTSPQEDAEQNPQLHSGVTSPLSPLVLEPEETESKDGLDLTSRLKAKALHYLISFSFCLYLLVHTT